jgi:hypothetical protein
MEYLVFISLRALQLIDVLVGRSKQKSHKTSVAVYTSTMPLCLQRFNGSGTCYSDF